MDDLQDRLIGSRYLGRYDNDDMSMKLRMVESEMVIRYDTLVRRLAEYGVHDDECALPLCVSTKYLPIILGYDMNLGYTID